MKRVVLGLSFLLVPILFVQCSAQKPADVAVKFTFSRSATKERNRGFPASAALMDCFLVNVRGQEVLPRYKPGQLPLITTPECLGFGAVSNTLSLATASTAGATLRIRPGPRRTIQVYGVAGVPSCGGVDFVQVLSSGSPTLHLLGSVEQDIAADTTVTIADKYDSSTTTDILSSCRLAPLPLFSNAGSGADDNVYALTHMTDGTRDVLVGGAFLNINSASRPYLARLDDSGSPVVAYNTALGTIDDEVLALLPTQGGKTYVAGKFSTIGVLSRVKLARLNADGTADSFNSATGFDGNVHALATARDDSERLFVGGAFSNYASQPISNIVALEADGTKTSTWITPPATGISVINSIDVDPLQTAVYLGGSGSNRLSKLDANTGTLDSGFITTLGIQPNGQINAVRMMPGDSSRFYIGGAFTTVGGQSRSRIARMLAVGTVDPTFSVGTGFNGTVYSITPVLDNTGDILVTGGFTTYDGNATAGVARITSTGALRSSFNIGTGSSGPSVLTAIAPKPRGNFEFSFYIGGAFSTFNGVALQGLARLNPFGGLN